MLPIIYTSPDAAGLFAVVCAIWYVPESIGNFWQWARVSRRGAVVQDRGSLAVLLVLQYVGLGLDFALAAVVPSAAIPWARTPLFFLGLVFILLGVGLRWWAILTLGRYFTRDVAVSADQAIVERGPYRLVRHPAYSGTFLTMLGVGLALANWAGLVALLLCGFLGYAYRVRVEEAALVRTLGQPYLDYMRRTRRFIPLVF